MFFKAPILHPSSFWLHLDGAGTLMTMAKPIPRSTRCNSLGKLRPRTRHGHKPIRWPKGGNPRSIVCRATTAPVENYELKRMPPLSLCKFERKCRESAAQVRNSDYNKHLGG